MPVYIEFSKLDSSVSKNLPDEKILDNLNKNKSALNNARDTISNMLSEVEFDVPAECHTLSSEISEDVDTFVELLKAIEKEVNYSKNDTSEKITKRNKDIKEKITEAKTKELASLKSKISKFYGNYKKYLYSSNSTMDLNWLTLRLDLGADKYFMFSEKEPFNKQLSDTVFTYYGGYLSFQKFLPRNRVILSLGVGLALQNNTDNLDLFEYTETKTTKDSTGSVVRQSKNNVSAYNGIFRSFTNLNLIFSGYWKPIFDIPAATTAFIKFSSNSLAQTLVLGIGGFIVKSSNALIPVAGVQAEYNIILNDKENNGLKNQLKINLVMSLPVDFGL